MRRAASPSPYAAAAAGIARAASPYGPPPPGAGMARSASPYQPQPGTVYPPGHVMEGRPVPQNRPISRAASPAPPGAYGPPSGYTTPAAGYGYAATGGYGAVAPGAPQYAVAPYPAGLSPTIPTAEQQPMLSAPEGFSRPTNLGLSYTRFETFKIQDMDDFYENIPKMPLVLQPHDVYHEDWIRLMTVRGV